MTTKAFIKERLTAPREDGVAPLTADTASLFLEYVNLVEDTQYRVSVIPTGVELVCADIMHNHLGLSGFNSRTITGLQVLSIFKILQCFGEKYDWRIAADREYVFRTIDTVDSDEHWAVRAFVAKSQPKPGNQPKPQTVQNSPAAANDGTVPSNASTPPAAPTSTPDPKPAKDSSASALRTRTKWVVSTAFEPSAQPQAITVHVPQDSEHEQAAQTETNFRAPGDAEQLLKPNAFSIFVKKFGMGHMHGTEYITGLMLCMRLTVNQSGEKTDAEEIRAMLAILALMPHRNITPEFVEKTFPELLSDPRNAAGLLLHPATMVEELILAKHFKIHIPHAKNWCATHRKNWEHMLAGALVRAHADKTRKLGKRAPGKAWPPKPHYEPEISTDVFDAYMADPASKNLVASKRATVIPLNDPTRVSR